MTQSRLTRGNLIDFGQFFDIKYDTDSQDNVYPDIYDEFQKGNVSKKKKGKFGKLLPGDIKK